MGVSVSNALADIEDTVKDVGDVASQVVGFNPVTLEVNQDAVDSLGVNEATDLAEGWNDMSTVERALVVVTAAVGGSAAGLGGTAAAEGSSELFMADMLGVNTAADATALETSIAEMSASSAGISPQAGEFLAGGTAGAAAPAATTISGAAATTAGISPVAETFAAPATFGLDAATGEALATGWEGMAAESAAQNAALGVAPATTAAASPGIIDSVLQFGQKNPALTLGAMSLAGGVAMGVGGYQTAMDLQEQKKKDAQEMEQWKRQFVQGGSYYDANVNMRPGTGVATRRSTGAPLHAGIGNPGLINSQMK